MINLVMDFAISVYEAIDELISKLVNDPKKAISMVLDFQGAWFAVFALFGVFFLPMFVLALTNEGVELKNSGALAAAGIAGGITFMTMLTAVETNMRNLREKWLESLRNELADYMGLCRVWLQKAWAVTFIQEKKKRCEETIEFLVREGGDEDDARSLDKAIEKLGTIEVEAKSLDRELAESTMNAFASYTKLNLRLRSSKKTDEQSLFDSLSRHYNVFRSISIRAKAGKEPSGIDGVDTELADSFSGYTKQEWERIKAGEDSIRLNKNIVGYLILSVIFSYGLYAVKSAKVSEDLSRKEMSLQQVHDKNADDQSASE